MGAGGVIILKKVLKDSLSVGLTQSGSVKLWHAVLAFGALCFVAGAVVF